MSLHFAASAFGVEAEIGRRELAVLEAIPGLLATVAAGEDDDPASLRLFPAAYGDDASEAEYRRFAASEIERAREHDRDVITEVLERLGDGSTLLTATEAECCVRAVGAARIAIAARHDMFDEDSLEAARDTPQGSIVAFLGLMQDEMLAALTDVTEAQQ